MRANEYQRLARRTANNELAKEEMLQHALYGMMSELGEINGLYQKVFQGHPLQMEHVRSELGDMLWFIAEFCDVNGFDLEDIMQQNIEKLQRRYPEGFAHDKSLHRAEGDF